MEKINRFIMKYFGWILYPASKLGKEEKNMNTQKHYENLGNK